MQDYCVVLCEMHEFSRYILTLILVSVLAIFCTSLLHTSRYEQELYRATLPAGGSGNCPTTVESSATSRGWIRNPRKFEAPAMGSRVTAE